MRLPGFAMFSIIKQQLDLTEYVPCICSRSLFLLQAARVVGCIYSCDTAVFTFTFSLKRGQYFGVNLTCC